jgi:hypothetical protein
LEKFSETAGDSTMKNEASPDYQGTIRDTIPENFKVS